MQRSFQLLYGGLALLLSLLGSLLWLDRHFPPPTALAHDTSPLVLDAQQRLLRGFSVTPGVWRLPVSVQDVDPLYLRMLLAYEDQHFMQHRGIDPLATVRATRQWLGHGRIVSGASTLTMQAARLLEPHQRDLLGKMREMLRALQLEWRYSKTEILNFYLTLAPYGANLEGIRAASLAWLGKEPKHLTAAQAALLVVLPQAPSRLRPDRYPQRARRARDKVLQRMVQLDILSERHAQEAMQEAVPHTRHHLPFSAPHLAQRLRNQHPELLRHHTFINRDLQQTLETLLRQQDGQLAAHSSVAVLVVEQRTRRVLAYVSGSDFHAVQRAGQLDLIRAVRSPGSALKPLIYGFGFDDLLLHPATVLEDVPTRFGNYQPSNFQHTYAGQLTVREALQQSLNIPAVAVLEQVGALRVAVRLREAGLPLRWDTALAQPALPLALGGVGMSLEQLVTLYAGIAERGQVAALRFSDQDAESAGYPLLSPTACWYLGEILHDSPLPPSVTPPMSSATPRWIAHKTGTSYGFRDAWALGFDPDYTVGVWVGRPDGTPSPGHYGRNTAAPLLFRVFELLPKPQHAPPAAPSGALTVFNHAQLPPRLRYFRTQPAAPDAAPLSISFPLHGTTLELGSEPGKLADLPLVAKGGMRPLRWLVNGMPLAADGWRREAFWSPDGEGMVRISVVDARGQPAHAEVWIQRPAAR